MGAFKDLTGMRYGELTVVCRAANKIRANGKGRTMWRCRCSCGMEIVVPADVLTRGAQISCGCYRKKHAAEMFTKHGKTNLRLYNVWSGIKSRCYNDKVYVYKFYGARGVTMCDEWKDSFEAFYDWAITNGYDADAPRGQCTIDRIDCNGNYSPENCRIVTQKQQMNNIRSNHLLEFHGETNTIAEWSRITGIDAAKIRNRIVVLGWTTERALTTP